jgi:hypothetical protein
MCTRYQHIEAILSEPIHALVVVSLAGGPLRADQLADFLTHRSDAKLSDETVARIVAQLSSTGVLEHATRGGHRVYELTNSGQRLARNITLVTDALVPSG